MSTLQSNLNFEDFQPKLESKETPESHILLVHLPGFAREDIGAKFEYDYRRVRVYGGRPIGDNISIRFSFIYAVPWNCDVNKLRGKFEDEIYCVIMPKVIISSEVPNQNAPKSSSHSIEAKPKMSQNIIPPKSTTTPEKGPMEISHKPKATNDFKLPKGKEGLSQILTLSIDAKNQTEERFEYCEKQTRVDKKVTKQDNENDMGRGKDKMEMNGKLGDADEGVYGKNIIGSPKGAKRFKEEDMQMLIYTSATVLVLALGVYASYKLRSSSARP